MVDIEALSGKELLSLYAQVLNALKDKGVTRSANNPVADYAEQLVANGLHLKLVGKSNAGFDAIDPLTNEKYEVKGRRMTRHNRSRQLSAIRNLERSPFDYLVGVIFDEDFTVVYAALMPIQAVIDHSSYVAHTNSRKLILRESVFEDSRVKNVTSQIAV